MEITDRLYGITMEQAGISKSVSVDILGMKGQVQDGQRDDMATLH
jgi:chromosome segregation ATPase